MIEFAYCAPFLRRQVRVILIPRTLRREAGRYAAERSYPRTGTHNDLMSCIWKDYRLRGSLTLLEPQLMC